MPPLSEWTPTPVPITEADLPTLARFIYSSNVAQPTNQFIFRNWPNEASQISNYLSSVKRSFEDVDLNEEMWKLVQPGGGRREDEMIASMTLECVWPTDSYVWRDEGPYEAGDEVDTDAQEEEVEAAMPKDDKGRDLVNREVQKVFSKAMSDLKKSMGGAGHLVLSSIYVKPEYRNRGYGTILVQWAKKRALKAEMPLFLVAMPSAHEFYQRRDFVDGAFVDLDLSIWAPPNGGYGVFRLQGMEAFAGFSQRRN